MSAGRTNLVFERSQLSSLAAESLSEAFAEFVAEVLALDFPGLHLFPDKGKDGAIDFSADVAGGRMVGECKLATNASATVVERRWNDVRQRLRRNITLPSGPPVGQSQYDPWYDDQHPIRQYVFCTSAVIKNQNRLDKLQRRIYEDLSLLGRTYAHVSHLRDVQVIVLDWHKLLEKANAHILFRWFARTRPQGLVPVEVSGSTEAGSFREYLYSDHVSYYSIGHHLSLEVPSEASELLAEDALLDYLEHDDALGLVITGAGGLGKTRLTLEIGRSAARRGWMVLRVHPPLQYEALDDLAASVPAKYPVLLLFDYVEIQPGFPGLVDRLAAHNATYELALRYVANCRTTYMPSLSRLQGQQVLDLSPTETAPLAAWRRSYRRHAVRHILATVGLGSDDRGVRVAGDRPILAVLMAYLHETGRGTELNDLLGAGDFGAWVSRRVELSFGHPAVARDLALLCGLLPIAQNLAALERNRFQPIVDRLAADGWIERADRGTRAPVWRAIHDVLVDQIVAGYLAGIPATTQQFAEELFLLAATSGTIDSALIAMQRLANLPILSAVDWLRVIDEGLGAFPHVWRGSRVLLLQTALLRESELLRLLSEHAAVWSGMARSVEAQSALAHLADRVHIRVADVTATEREVLLDWLQEAAAATDVSNMVLTRALRYCPDRVADRAAGWLRDHVYERQADFVLVAWLRAGLDPSVVQPSVIKWLERYAATPYASFLISAWLEEAGEADLVRRPVERWLTRNALDRQAAFVFSAWLDGKGDTEAVRGPIRSWLAVHPTDTAAPYVYSAWLDAEGELEEVRRPIEQWLAKNGTDLSASYVYRAWLGAKGELEVVRESMKCWLAQHATWSKAPFLYRAWLNAEGDLETVREPIERWLAERATEPNARFIFEAWLDADLDPDVLREALDSWLRLHADDLAAHVIYRGWLDGKGAPDAIRGPLAQWLTAHATDRVAQVVYRAWLAAKGDRELVHDHLVRWLTEHANHPSAPLVYRAWLRANGELDVVAKPIERWLRQHPTDDTSQSVYTAWLKAKSGRGLVHDPIERWLVEHDTDTTAAIVAKACLEAKAAREPIERWLVVHVDDSTASCVYRAWLSAKGEFEVVRDPIERWLAQHATDWRAQFVYKAWLDANGELEVVRDPIERWLAQHATDWRAQFVYKAWLDADGELSLVREPIQHWLLQHATDPAARFVYCAWLEAQGDREVIRGPIERWMAENASDDHARFVSMAWLKSQDRADRA